MNAKVDAYLIDGCGRCSFYKTPQCKVHTWTEALLHLRRIALECGLHETIKWSQPCYTIDNRDILLVTAFKEFASIAFFKGALLKDTHNLLVAPGDNSQASRQLRFTEGAEIRALEVVIKSYIQEAIELEKAGSKIAFKKTLEPVPDELKQQMAASPELKNAFEALTPGRQRGYILYFSQPKQSRTRMARIEKCIPKILKGEGIHDAYRAMKR